MRKLKIVPPIENGNVPLMRPAGLAHRHLISLLELTSAEIEYILDLAQDVKAAPEVYQNALEGRTLAMIFEKPSLRTRVTFELGISQLGGRALYLGSDEVGLGKREAIKDVARNLSCWVDVIMARVHSHQTAIELAEHASVPVINGLSDFEHPCQALGDFMTILECKGSLPDVTLAWVGDGNNVAHSLIHGAARLGIHLRVATPAGYEPDRSVVADAKRQGADVTLTHSPVEAVAGADVVYTDVWTSMGYEQEAETRQEAFRAYQVNAQLMRAAGPQALFMHCQPARRGEEVTDEVMDSPRSIVYQQAQNHLHTQKAIFLALLS
ncbi:MAG: ornithine carbamoyltransferase [Acidobacteriota bacterium]|nr:ornithine carbamoyltransferase [Acidobacteriota bacterium]